MKNDKILTLLPGAIAIGIMTYLASTHVAARYFFDGAVVLSYIAVAALLVIASVDYRSEIRDQANR